MLAIFLVVGFVATVQAQYCVPCEAIKCVGGRCVNDADGCAQCDGLIQRKRSARIDRGTCVEECDSGLNSDLNLPPCLEGYQCRSNGCGHTCQKVRNQLEKRDGHARRGSCLISCHILAFSESDPLACKEGYKCRSNGCGMSCQKVDDTVEKKDGHLPIGACVIACHNGNFPDSGLPTCQEGYQCRSNGCGLTCQKIVGTVEKKDEHLRRGACVIACHNGNFPDSGLPTCQEGYQCRSNGCGLTCQKIVDTVEKKDGHLRRGACVIACDNGNFPDSGFSTCQEGYQCRSNGCGLTCQKIVDEPTIGLCAEMCENGCPNGYACLSNGCGHSCQ